MRHPFVAFPTVDKTRETIREQKEVTVQLINYTKSGNFESSSDRFLESHFSPAPSSLGNPVSRM